MTPSSIEDFEARIAQCWRMLDWGGLRAAVACSGGPDSIALLAAAARCCPTHSTIFAFHYNHQLRGADSDRDEACVRRLCDQLGCPFVVARSDGSSNLELPNWLSGASSALRGEALWRHERYAFFRSAAESTGVRYVALAHTADDQVETLLHNLFRGGGIAGLAGMKAFRPIAEGNEVVLARPMLSLSRQDVLRYLAEWNLEYCLDRSNADTQLHRNWIRLELLPFIEKSYGVQVKQRILQSSESLSEIRDWIDTEAKAWIESHYVRTTPQGFQLELTKTQQLPWPVLLAAIRMCWTACSWGLREMNHQHWLAVRRVFDSHTPATQNALTLPNRVLVSKDESMIYFLRDEEVSSRFNALR